MPAISLNILKKLQFLTILFIMFLLDLDVKVLQENENECNYSYR